MTKKLSAALIVAHSTHPPPKPQEIIRALVERERVRLTAFVAAREQALEEANKAVTAARSAFALSLIPEGIDAAMAAEFGARKSKIELEYDHWDRDETRRSWYTSVCYGSKGAILKTASAWAKDSALGRAFVAAHLAAETAEKLVNECKIRLQDRNRTSEILDSERWIRGQLVTFKAKAEGSLPSRPIDPSRRIAAMLADDKTVAALDTIRDRINSAKPGVRELLAVG